MKRTIEETVRNLTPVTEWKEGVQDGKRIVKRDRRQLALYAGLPYIIHKDFHKLVRLTRMWQVVNRQDYYRVASPKLRSLSSQCELLYYRIYGHWCYYGDVPFDWKY